MSNGCAPVVCAHRSRRGFAAATRTVVIAAFLAVTAGCGHAASLGSRGFATAPSTSERRIACATDVGPGRSPRLLCSWPSAACQGAEFRHGCYDQRAVVELLGSGSVRRLAAGNDVLLAIDRHADRTLANRATWSRGGFRCSRTGDAVSCRRGAGTFTLTPTRLDIP